MIKSPTLTWSVPGHELDLASATTSKYRNRSKKIMVIDERASLSFRGGPNDGKTLSLSGGPLVVRRGPDNDIDVNDSTVSRRTP